MSLIDELEAMANAVSLTETEEIDSTICRWQSLFGYSAPEALDKISVFRASPRELIIYDSHWEMLRYQKEQENFDREAYEYWCTTARKSYHSTTITKKDKQRLQATTFLLKLEGPLQSVDAVAKATNMVSIQETMMASDSSGQSSSFCKVNGLEKIAIETFLSESNIHSAFRPTFIRISVARKELSTNSIHPTLGVDSTMPQYRLSNDTDNSQPAQDEYPVWYFFYGTLAESETLSDLLGIDPVYRDAKIPSGVLGSWGSYKALVNDPSGRNTVYGKAFLVTSEEDEEALRLYETEAYEMVRCRIEMDDGEVVDGLTFRWAGQD
ncbi:hypothetical protein CEP52_002358 [Fusarium oligoseptatum]|uniref:Putative gamma-glutamylcyclotransferase n=1 Tax=Fusarium oligoseptatum TaxID=2604345 RepID=A0A428UE46_9HYPO|nr:hypothetical protein CEP52_002358 [Fusarium oligoseptatum]